MAPSRAIGLFALVLSALLVSGCAGTGCEEWVTRTEPIRVCGPKGMNCTVKEEPVRYCVRRAGERAAAPAPARPEQVRAAPAPVRPEPERAAPAPERIVKADAAPVRPDAGPKARAGSKSAAPNLTAFWQSLFSSARYSGLRYGKVRRVTTGPKNTPASSAQVEAALKTRVRSVVSMHVASDSKFTPMDHQLSVTVYRAHDRDAAIALYGAMVRDEWRERKPQSRPGVTLVVVNTADRKKPGSIGQRTYLQRGSHVIEVDEWKSIYRNAAGKPVPGKEFPHSAPLSADVVVKAVVGTFPAE